LATDAAGSSLKLTAMSFDAQTSFSVALHNRHASFACAFGTLDGGLVLCAAVAMMTITTMTNAAP
jgi:hypothetical protein